jgi:hypothetical protein
MAVDLLLIALCLSPLGLLWLAETFNEWRAGRRYRRHRRNLGLPE